MNLWFRFLLYVLSIPRRPRIGAMGMSQLSFRVMPNDLDVNLHMNNGRYLTLMDLGRLDLIVSADMAKEILRRGWKPMLGGAYITYRRELGPFQEFRLETRILGWDERWFYMSQQFFRGDVMHADAVVKALFVGPKGKVPCEEVMGITGHDGPSPILDDKVLARFAR